MKAYCISSLLFLLTVIPIFSKTSFEEANHAYASGDFYKAVQLYKKIIIEKGESSDIYYNLGNSYYRLKQIAYAILYYERSILINPYNREARFNLEVAKLKTIDKMESIDSFFLIQWVQAFQDRYSIFQWSIIGICCFVFLIICLVLFCFAYTKKYKKIGFYLGWIFLLFCIVSNIFAYNQKENQSHRRTAAIIVVPAVTVKSSPDRNGKDLFILHEGSKVKIKDTLDHWISIETLSRNTGWIQNHELQII